MGRVGRMDRFVVLSDSYDWATASVYPNNSPTRRPTPTTLAANPNASDFSSRSTSEKLKLSLLHQKTFPVRVNPASPATRNTCRLAIPFLIVESFPTSSCASCRGVGCRCSSLLLFFSSSLLLFFSSSLLLFFSFSLLLACSSSALFSSSCSASSPCIGHLALRCAGRLQKSPSASTSSAWAKRQIFIRLSYPASTL